MSITIATPTEADINAVLAAAAAQEAYEAQEQAPAPTEAQPADEANVPFKEMVDAVSDPNAVRGCHNMVANLQTRAVYEREKHGYNENIQKTLSKLIAKFHNIWISRAMIAGGVNEDFFNESEVAGKRRNVYAIEKVPDFLLMAIGNPGKNPTNVAIITSLFRCAAQQLPFTSDIAKACASDKFPLPVHYQPFVRQHTAAQSTGRSQFSSTMTALEILGVVKQVGGKKAQVWELTDSPMTKAIEQMVRKYHFPV